jgi:adenine deaminase
MISKASIHDSEQTVTRLQHRIKVARGDQPASLVIRNTQWLDVFSGAWQTGDVAIFDGVIVGVADSYEGVEVVDGKGGLLVPGFIDAHVHVESSMMTPKQFLRAVLPRGTTSVIWDPHEIANVKGVRGIQWALDSTEALPLGFFVMVPSCVPSTSAPMQLESSGAELFAGDIQHFAKHPRVLGLAEMMNWPGLVGGDLEVMAKLTAFQDKKRDGHCPGLSGKLLNAYGVAGIHSCHESTTKAEAREKLTKGIHVLIREGSCAKDADELLPILDAWTSATVGLCSDDRNPLDIEESGHLDCIINKGLTSGISPVAVFRAASFSVAKMYGLEDRGAIAPGYRADLVLVTPVASKSPKGIDFSQGINVSNVWRGGIQESKLLAELFGNESTSSNSKASDPFFGEKNLHIKSQTILASDFKIASTRDGAIKARVIGVRPGQIVTESLVHDVEAKNGQILADAAKGLNKISVIERHHQTGRMATGLVFGLDLKSGAIATSINHDCHNVIVTGSSDEYMAEAVAQLRKMDGGIAVVGEGGASSMMALPIGGLMTNDSPETVAKNLRELKKLAKKIGCQLEEPFLQISFLALPVIPNLKITDRGLVDGSKFEIVTVELK